MNILADRGLDKGVFLVASTDTDESAARAAVVRREVIGSWRQQIGQIMPHFLLVCGDSSQAVGVVIIEAPSMPQAHTNAVTRGLAAVEAHELSTEMMTSVLPTQIGRIMSGAEAAQMIVRLVQGRVKPEEMTGRFPRPWRVVEHPASFTVQDATGQNVAWFYFRNDPGIAQSIAVLFKQEARRRAMNFARLPEAPGAEKGSHG
jgi:hypothetical protein